VLDWHRALIRLRRHSTVLRNGDYQNTRVTFDELENWFAIFRGSVVTACNLSGERRNVPLDGAHRIILASSRDATMAGNSLVLPPDAVAIVERDV
jgi:maltooligosyltrehalose trehalohydrolase